MLTSNNVTFAVAVNQQQVFEANFLASPCFRQPHSYQILDQRNFTSAASAYNNALENSRNDIVIFAHQDMYFPQSWLLDLEQALSYLQVHDPHWGVLGCYGVTADGQPRGHLYSSGLGVLDEPMDHPVPVRTLDEIVLVVRKSSGLTFDEALPGFHLYGSDLCLRAAEQGMNSYVVPAFCMHNTQMNLVLPADFYACYRHFKRTWRHRLPIHTSCITVSRFNLKCLLRRAREAYITQIRRRKPQVTRLPNPESVLEALPHRSCRV
jgi:hypothetical protein